MAPFLEGDGGRLIRDCPRRALRLICVLEAWPLFTYRNCTDLHHTHVWIWSCRLTARVQRASTRVKEGPGSGGKSEEGNELTHKHEQVCELKVAIDAVMTPGDDVSARRERGDTQRRRTPTVQAGPQRPGTLRRSPYPDSPLRPRPQAKSATPTPRTPQGPARLSDGRVRGTRLSLSVCGASTLFSLDPSDSASGRPSLLPSWERNRETDVQSECRRLLVMEQLEIGQAYADKECTVVRLCSRNRLGAPLKSPNWRSFIEGPIPSLPHRCLPSRRESWCP